ncbi:MAG: rhodanese-like domain-containing protein [Ilumatobacteraceae bacterium]
MTTTIPGTDVIGVATLQDMLIADPQVRILDVRTGGEFETVHIPGSYNVPLDTLAEHSDDLADVEHPVVLVCQSGGRATQAHGKLRVAGKERLHILEGGMLAWRAAGGDVVEGTTGRWAMDRQVRLVAGSLVLAGVLGSVLVPKAKWLAGGVASGLVFSAVSNTCAMGDVLAKLPYNQTDQCDIAGVLDDLRAAA